MNMKASSLYNIYLNNKSKLKYIYKHDTKYDKYLHKYLSMHTLVRFIVRICFYLLLFGLSFIFIYPFLDMIVTSLKSTSDLMNITVKWIPNSLMFSNYVVAIEQLQYLKYFKNSVFVTTVCIIGHVLSCSFVAYGFSRYKFPFRDSLFSFVIFTLIVPVQVIIFPLYIFYSKLGWVNSYLPIIVPTFFGYGLKGGLFIFLFRQFFAGLPYELEEAARVDGCRPLRTFFTIILPVSKSAILVSIVLSMVWHWNDYFEPNIYIAEKNMHLLPSRLPALYNMLNTDDILNPEMDLIINEAIVLAATFLVVLPILIVYSLVQNKFMEGIERSGLTGQ